MPGNDSRTGGAEVRNSAAGGSLTAANGEKIRLSAAAIDVLGGGLSLNSLRGMRIPPSQMVAASEIARTGDPVLIRKYRGLVSSGFDNSVFREVIKDLDSRAQ